MSPLRSIKKRGPYLMNPSRLCRTCSASGIGYRKRLRSLAHFWFDRRLQSRSRRCASTRRRASCWRRATGWCACGTTCPASAPPWPTSRPSCAAPATPRCASASSSSSTTLSVSSIASNDCALLLLPPHPPPRFYLYNKGKNTRRHGIEKKTPATEWREAGAAFNGRPTR